MSTSQPVRLTIPALGVSSSLLSLGLERDGTLEVPPDGTQAGWYRDGPTPGELGPAVVVGHVDWAARPGVFVDLGRLKANDVVSVLRADGRTALFRVKRVRAFPKSDFPTEEVYGDLAHAGLRLITCGGTFNRQSRSYEENVVVFADLV